MDNNVVVAVYFALTEQGFVTMRFNFRSVGNSQGEHTRGKLEHQEAVAALEFLKAWPGVDGDKPWTGWLLLRQRRHPEKSRTSSGLPRVFAFISPSLQALQSSCMKEDPRPKLLITGEMDRLAPSPECQPTLDSFTHPFRLPRKLTVPITSGWARSRNCPGM